MLFRRSIGLSLLMFVFVLILGNSLAQDGEVLMDIGFRPAEHGFSFENYGENIDAINLTPVEMVILFGEAVCSSEINEEGYCDLTPNAQLWMEQVSEAMSIGHCEGMAVLSLLMYGEHTNPADFGADFAVDLSIEENEYLQRAIGLWWATQATFPAYANVVQGTPSEIVETLVNRMEDEYFTIGFYLPDRTGGHAVSPYAVVDVGDGIYLIMIYDNNYPGEERFIEVDANAETWVYTGSTNPAEPSSEYYGDAETRTLELSPMLPRLETQFCDFCGFAGSAGDDSFTGVSLNGRGSLTVTDTEGRTVGIVDGKLVNEIPGARVRANKNGYSSYLPPSIYIPTGIEFSTKIKGQEGFGKPATGISITQKGSVAILSGITLGELEDVLDFAGGNIRFNAGEDDDELSFRQGVSAQSGKNYLYEVSGSSSSLYFEFDPESGDIRISGDDDGSTFAVGIERYNEDGSHDSFYDEDVEIDGGLFGDLNASEWDDEMDIGYEEFDDEDELDEEFDDEELDDEEFDDEELDDEEFDDEELDDEEFDDEELDDEDELDDEEFDDSEDEDEFDDSEDDSEDDSGDDGGGDEGED